MPAPMPPQGPPPQGPPSDSSGPPSGAQGQGGGSGAISTLLSHTDSAIDQLSQVIGQSKATSPEEKKMIQQIDQLYGQLMSSLGMGDSDDSSEPPGGGQGQTVSPEAAGNPGAVPQQP